jgi:hypothetical protein
MSNISDIKIPTIYPFFPKVQRDYPISERENLMRALNHEKPLWMPNFPGSSQLAGRGGIGFEPGFDLKDGDTITNAWGMILQHSEAQGSPTPINHVLSEVSKFREEIHFPDLDVLYAVPSPPDFVRDENLSIMTHIESACFEELHMMEGFEQALIDLISEPEKCREFFETLVDMEIEIFRRENEFFHFDYVMYHDDWGTQRAPFFSLDLFKETILPPTIRLVQEIKKSGVKLFFHNCGKVDQFIPYLIEEIGADGLEIQTINDIKGILQKYGDRVTVEYQSPDPYLLFDPNVTLDQVRGLARKIVDEYGAASNPGAGCIVNLKAPTAEIYNTFEEEMFSYSLKQYRGLK